MNFGLSSLGRLVAGVRGFYNEINSATLTGAIDVLIVRQEDGTYNSSPFHVRFGKLGVLRSRQKVVDITINGVPVEDLHMKLGEAGEAFFVELVEDDSEIDESVLDQLATSPIPTDGASLMEKGIAKLKDQVKKEEATATRSETTPSAEKTPTFRSSISLKLQDLHPEATGACKSDSSHDEMSEAEESRRKVLKKRRSRSGKSSPRSPLGPDAERGEMFEMDVSGTESSEEELTKATLLASQLKEGGGNLNLDAFTGHPLSDPELSPVGSPLPTRPPSPKSDSEVDKQRQEESQSGMLMEAGGGAKWEWGGFPQTSTPDSSKETRSSLPLSPPATAPPSPPQQTPLSADCTDSKPPTSSGAPPASVPSKDGGDQSASPDTATSAKCKEESAKAKPEPKYLSELDLEDPEVAKLYLSGIGRFETIREKDEDTESGRGASLPQSPHSVEGAVCGPSSVSFLQSEVRHLGTFSLSLCGGLAEPEELNLEKFMLKVVTYDDLCENPGIVHSPDLVVKVNDKYYNWATAAPMVLSQAVYHKDLSEKAVKSLAKEHMPRKEKKKRGGLSWLWRRGQQDSDDAEVPQPLPTSSTSTAPASVSTGSSDSTHKPATTDTTSSVATVAPAADVAAPATTAPVPPPTTFSVSVDTAFASTVTGDAAGTIPSDVSETVSVAAPRLSVSEGRLVTTAATTTNTSPRPTYTEVMTGSTTSLPMSSVAPVICKDQHSSDGDTDGSDRMSSPELSPPSSPPRKGSNGSSSLPSSIPGASSSTRSQRSSESSESPSSSVDPGSPHTPPHTEASPHLPQKKAGTPPKSPSIVVTISPGGDVAGTMEQTVVDVPDSAATTPATAAVAVAAALGAKEPVVLTGTEEEERKEEEEGAKPPVDAATTVKPKEGRPRKEKYIKSLRLSSEKIAKLNLHEGVNEVIYSVTTAYQGTTRCCSHIFLWNHSDKIVISDIDGTITRSDVLGQILPIIGKDWSQFGVANLFTRIADNGYKLLYLSARAIGQSRATKELLKNICQDNSQVLPLGPLMLNPTSLLSAFHREVIVRKPEEFKISCLKDVADLFPCNPFYAGFGNKINDVWTYQALNIQKSRIFTINHRGQLINELNQTYQSSYSQMSNIVDHVFPPIRQATEAECLEFSNFNYWRTPLPDLAAVERDLEDLRARDKKSPPSSPKK